MMPELGRFNHLLACPRCSQGLSPGGNDALVCPGCGEGFPVVGGIPRFTGIAGDYAASFGFQWNIYEVMDDEEDRAVFREKTSLRPEELSGLTVLDAGVGSGRYARIAARHAGLFVGIDLSLAVERAKKAVEGLANSLIVQGDLLGPPLAAKSFDFVYSIGVIHHTPDTREAFRSLARLVAPGGRLAVWVYRRNTLLQEALNDLARAYTTRLGRGTLMRLLDPVARLGGVPGIKHLSKVINFSTHPRLAIRLCDTFDWYSPAYQHHHTQEEVMGWYREEGFEEVRLLMPEKAEDPFYRRMFERGLIIGSGVNVIGRRPPDEA